MRGREKSSSDVAPAQRHDYWGVNIDAPDPATLARFYAELLEWEIAYEEPDDVAIRPPDGVSYLAFQRADPYQRPVWPHEHGTQQIMMHLDFEVSDLDAAVGSALAAGAELAAYQPQEGVRVLLDPAGHPFCLYLSGGDEVDLST